MAAESFQKKPFNFVLPDKNEENDHTLQGICQIGKIPNVRR